MAGCAPEDSSIPLPGDTEGGAKGNPHGGSGPTSGGNGSGGTNNTGNGGGNNPGSGGASGGSGNGGSGNGGANNGGASTSSGGNRSGGSGNGTSGGASNGGRGSGGASNGGASNGGASNGGASSGGKSAGGNGMGGAAAGGKSAGGAAMGGAASGGATTTGSGGGSITSTCTEAQRTLTANGSGKHCGYTYEYWKDSGSGSLVLKPDGFSVDWSNINNLLGRKGIRPGSTALVATYESDYKPNGNSYLCIYGWTRNPLVEYYIVDSWGTWRPPGATAMGTVSSDGGTYDIYRTQRVNQPSIDGNTTFYQYWSVRQAKRTSGTITVGNHFTAWAAKGMPTGTFYEVSMTVEGYQSSGTATVKMQIK